VVLATMKHWAALPAIVGIFILTTAFQTRTPPFRNTAKVTLTTESDSRATFERLAKAAALRIIFSSNFVSRQLGSFNIDMSVSEALDLVSKQTGDFWAMWDTDTVLVAPDNEVNRRTYERVFVAIIEIPRQQDPKAILETVKGSIAVGNKIVVRNTFSEIEKVKQAVAELLGTTSDAIDAVFVGSSNEVFLTNGGSGQRSTTSKRSQLTSSTPGRVSINESDTTHRAIYERLGGMAGLNVMFGRNFPTRSLSFQVEDMDFFEALDLLSLQTRSIWQPIHKNTILILEDTGQNRRDFELHQAETIYLSEGTTDQRLNDVVRALRTVFALRGIYHYAPRKAIVLHDTPSNILLAEDLIAALEGTPTLSKAVITDLTTAFPEAGGAFQSSASTRATLKVRVAGTLPINQNGDVKTAYETVAQAAGLSVLFGARFPSRSVDFRIDNVDAVEALDLLALQTGTFWQALDEHTIVVMEDTQQNRRDSETHLVKTILLPITTATTDVAYLMNILRTAFSLRGIYQSSVAKAIVIHDTPNRVALTEKVIRQLIPNPNSIVSLTVPAPGFAENRVLSKATEARSQLDFTSVGTISKPLNQDARISYETLAEMGGIKISFDPRFNAGAPMPLRLEGMDVPDALDRLSLQTGNYWTVLDRKTILVAPDTAQVRQQFDPQVTRLVSLKTLTQGLATELVAILRTLLSMRQVEQNGAYSVTIKDTPQRVAIAEQIIANLDRP
jgi:hypothetical protein